MNKIKAFLEKYPRIYKVVRKIYLFFVTRYIYFGAYLTRNRIGAGYAKRGSEWVGNTWEGLDHPHRPFLVEKIAVHSPVSSILEIGCWTGMNLYLLSKRFPDASIRGIDINPLAVQKGNEWFAQEGISNVSLSVGRAEDLGNFHDKSFDVIFTDAVLIYVSRGKIYGVIEEMLRIARKGLIFVEWYNFNQQLRDKRGLGVFTGYWVRDYVALLKQFVSEEQIRVTRITQETWPNAGWIKNGALIEVTIP